MCAAVGWLESTQSLISSNDGNMAKPCCVAVHLGTHTAATSSPPPLLPSLPSSPPPLSPPLCVCADDDSEFVPTAEMYIHGDIDDEQTINEEELLEDEDQPEEEIDDLMKVCVHAHACVCVYKCMRVYVCMRAVFAGEGHATGAAAGHVRLPDCPGGIPCWGGGCPISSRGRVDRACHDGRPQRG